MNLIEPVANFLWGPWTPWVLLAAGILFTVWTRFTQALALTHGVAVIRGVYDDPKDPGAINHFQALSAALSATVGLGNIGGVALAIGMGGPGALFWIWVVGLFGMALKTIEVTLAMLYRNTDDPDNPHGGAMWVVHHVVGGKGGAWKPIARGIGIFFCLTLLVSAFTGGNMFQCWNVALLTERYFGVPRLAVGIFIAALVGSVIIGGIKRIGQVAGKLVPFMCILYVLSGLSVLALHVTEIPSLLASIVTCAFNPTEAGGAFLGATVGFAFMEGMKRSLFSNEAGQGSAPIAHSAAKTDEPAREGVVAGLEPFIDTLCVCTLTALVILATGAWNRDALVKLDQQPVVAPAYAFDDTPLSTDGTAPAEQTVVFLPVETATGAAAADRLEGRVLRDARRQLVVRWNTFTATEPPIPHTLGLLQDAGPRREPIPVATLATTPAARRATDDGGTPDEPADDLPLWGLITAHQAVDIEPAHEFLWENLSDVFAIVQTSQVDDAGRHLRRLPGTAALHRSSGELRITWGTVASETPPTVSAERGVFREYDGATLTAHAFDLEFPRLGKWLVTIAAWLFAVSTMISWSYYGEQGVVYMTGGRGVLLYKLLYLVGIIYASAGIGSAREMTILMDLGTGAMLWSNIPIVLALGFLAVRSLNDYTRRLRAGEMPRHKAPPMADVIDGRDVE